MEFQISVGEIKRKIHWVHGIEWAEFMQWVQFNGTAGGIQQMDLLTFAPSRLQQLSSGPTFIDVNSPEGTGQWCCNYIELFCPRGTALCHSLRAHIQAHHEGYYLGTPLPGFNHKEQSYSPRPKRKQKRSAWRCLVC